jgi:hypothetical protein
MFTATDPTWNDLMSDSTTDGTFDECVDELNDFISTLQRYPPAVLAFALRAHLCELLRALELHGQWSTTEVASFLEEMASEIGETSGVRSP